MSTQLRVPATVRRVLLEDGREYAVPPRGISWHRVERQMILWGGVAEFLLLHPIPVGGDELLDVIEALRLEGGLGSLPTRWST